MEFYAPTEAMLEAEKITQYAFDSAMAYYLRTTPTGHREDARARVDFITCYASIMGEHMGLCMRVEEDWE